MIKRLITVALFSALAVIHAAGQAQPNRFPPINLVAGDPTGTSCPAHSMVQSSDSGILYTCQGGAYHTAGGQTIPVTAVTWPPSCTTGTYVPATNTCVPTGTAANPGGTAGQTQINAGGSTFIGIPGSMTDATYGWKTQGGTQYAKGFQTGGGDNGLANAFTTTGQTVVADPSYGNTEYYGYYSSGGNPLTHPWAMGTAQSHLTDYRSGAQVDTFRDPVVSLFDQVNSAHILNLQSYTQQGAGSLGNLKAQHIYANFWAPGFSFGSATTGPTNWSQGYGLAVNLVTATPGLHEALAVGQYKTGIGDNVGAYFYDYSYGGATAGSDEGNHGIGFHGDEAGITFKGTVTTGGGGANATAVHINCTVDCNLQFGGPGDGRYLVDQSAVIDSGNVISGVAPAGNTPGIFTIDHAITPSNAIGTIATVAFTGTTVLNTHTINSLSSVASLSLGMTVTGSGLPAGGGFITAIGASSIDLSVNASSSVSGSSLTAGNCNAGGPPNPVGTGYNTVSCSVTVTSGAFVAGNTPVCFNGNFHEQALITSVSGTSLTMNLRHAHPTGSVLAQGGPCGTFINFTPNDAVTSTTLHYPIDLIGAPDSTHLYYAFFYTGLSQGLGGAMGGMGAVRTTTQAATNLTNVGGVVYMTTSLGGNVFVGSTIQISSASVAGYNGPCTNAKYVQSTNQVNCVQAASNGLGTAATATVISGTSQYGNSAYVTWAGAEVLDVLDRSVNPPVINNVNVFTLTTEPNNGAWPNGGAVEEAHHYAARFGSWGTTYFHNKMVGASSGFNINVGGSGSCCGNFGVGGSFTNSFAAFSLANALPATNNYIHHGGFMQPPGGILLTGAYNYGLVMITAPDPLNAPVVYAGCPVSGCGDPTFYYYMLQSNGNGGNAGLRYFPYGNVFETSGNWQWNSDFGFQTFRDLLRFSPLTVPTLSTPTTSTSGGSLADSTTYFYTVYARNNSGIGLQSVEKSIATGASGGATNSNSLAWTRVAGAVQYIICRSTSTGTELTGPTLSGVDSLSWIDNGTASFSGACNTTDGSRGGVDQASYVGLNSSTTGFQLSLKAPAGMAANATITVTKLTGISITPAAVTASTCAEQTFSTYTGLATGQVVSVSPPAFLGAHVWIASTRVSATNTLAIAFCADATGGTPPAGAYLAIAF